jgi:hypothetical protein
MALEGFLDGCVQKGISGHIDIPTMLMDISTLPMHEVNADQAEDQAIQG